MIGVVTDVTSQESVEALRDATLAEYGAVHIVCNNAGIGSGSEGHIWEHHANDWRWSLDVNVMGVVNGINAFVPTLLAQDEEGHVVNTTSGNGGFTPLINSAVYATTKAAVVTITECLWGQLREIDAKVGASLLYPSTRTPGVLDTGIWRPGANRPEQYDRPGAPPKEGRDALAMFKERMDAVGMPVEFAPLSEVADICFEGIMADTFWITAPSEAAAGEDPAAGGVADRHDASELSARGQPHDHVGFRRRLSGRRPLGSPRRQLGLRSTRRRSWALRATTIVERLMRIAPTAGERANPAQANTPAASGMATTL